VLQTNRPPDFPFGFPQQQPPSHTHSPTPERGLLTPYHSTAPRLRTSCLPRTCGDWSRPPLGKTRWLKNTPTVRYRSGGSGNRMKGKRTRRVHRKSPLNRAFRVFPYYFICCALSFSGQARAEGMARASTRGKTVDCVVIAVISKRRTRLMTNQKQT